MTPDQYVATVLSRYDVPRGLGSPAIRFKMAVAPALRAWGNRYLFELSFSGSYSKNTAIRGMSDVDLLISLKPTTPENLGEIYESLFAWASRQGWSPRRQNVSIGVHINGISGDLVPGKLRSTASSVHSLYVHKRSSWTQTDISVHTRLVRKSRRTREIRALKLWCHLRGLDFPSLYLELFAINALAGRSHLTVAQNVLELLRFASESLTGTRIVDPANTNNVLSADLTAYEKTNIAREAARSLREPHWEGIIW